MKTTREPSSERGLTKDPNNMEDGFSWFDHAYHQRHHQRYHQQASTIRLEDALQELNTLKHYIERIKNNHQLHQQGTRMLLRCNPDLWWPSTSSKKQKQWQMRCPCRTYAAVQYQ